MKVILLEKVPNVGGLGDVANVRGGYARNYLFPQGKAERATPRAVADFERRRDDLEKRQTNREDVLRAARDALDGYLLQMPARASADGGLYGSITPAAIAAALNAQKLADIDIRRGHLTLPGGNLKEVGDHEVGVSLAPGIEAKITVAALAEDAPAAKGAL
ncbi:MAG: 50S ribosomal protein L9 [Gammaproteobacteria bacterium]